MSALCGLGGWGTVQAAPAASSGRATLNFNAAEIEAVSRAMAAVMGQPIVVDPRVTGKINLFSDEPVTRAQAYALYTQALRGQGFALVTSNGLLKVVPEAEAKLQSGTVLAKDQPGPGADQVVTQIFRLAHENAKNLVAVLRPLIPANNTITLSAGNNALVITDYLSNLTRLGAIISALDTPSATDVEVMPLQYALASDLAMTVQRLSDAGGQAAGAGTSTSTSTANTVVADPHSNALLVRAPNQSRLAAVRALVAQLDRPTGAGVAGSNVHVVYLKNAEAVRLAEVLRAAFATEASRGNGAKSSGGGASSPSRSGQSKASEPSGGATSSAANASASSGSASSQSTASVTVTDSPSLSGYIQADPASNALIITAAQPLFRELRAVVDLLDSPRAQLYVESLVVEVDASKALDVGVQWQQIFNISSSTDLTLGTVATALQSMSGTNILSTANLVTLDNEEAKIVVGQNVPFVTGSYTSSSSTSSPFQTIERKDVGITLRIRPQIGENGKIRMTIFQESSSVASTSTSSGPTTNKRSIESTVSVQDGKILVLGGLIEDSYTSDANDLVGLSSIPLLGGLFRSLSKTHKKSNLVVFLRPVVMRDDLAVNAMSLNRYDYIRAQQQALPEDVRQVMPDATLPSLAAEPASGDLPH